MATSHVANIGYYEYSLRNRSGGVSEDGAIIIASDLQRRTSPKTILYEFTDTSPWKAVCTRFITAESNIVRDALQDLPKTRSKRFKKMVRIKIVEPDQDGWHLHPHSLTSKDADVSSLPESFRKIDPEAFVLRPSMPYAFDEESVNLVFGSTELPQDMQHASTSLHGIGMLLIVPAIAIDIVTFPIQFLYVINEISQIGW
jgi:hypothetical protein